jgi:hypothetical protein
VTRHVLGHLDSACIGLSVWSRQIAIVRNNGVSAGDARRDAFGEELVKISLDKDARTILHFLGVHTAPVRLIANVLAMSSKSIATDEWRRVAQINAAKVNLVPCSLCDKELVHDRLCRLLC